MPEQSIRDIIYQVRYGNKTIDVAISEIKEVLKKEIIECFVKEVERRAELKILLTHKLEGAHYAAMKELLAEGIE